MAEVFRPSAPTPPDRLLLAAPTQPAATKPESARLLVWGSFAFVMAVALLVNWVAPIAATAAQQFAAEAKTAMRSGGIMGLMEFVSNAAAWAALIVMPVMAILLAFLCVEWLLVGRPQNLGYTFFCLLLQAAIVLGFYFASPYLQQVLPTSGLSYAYLRSSQFPDAFGPLVDLVVALAMLGVIGFAGYWVHRAQHKIPVLWRFHAVHHSIEDMEAARDVSHPLDAIGDRVGVIAISFFLGFEYTSFALLMAFMAIRGRLVHSRAPINFGPLGRIFVDNRFHFAHHSVRPEYFDRNYGGFITLYDRIFGTYVAPPWTGLEVTGIPSKHPPANVWQFLTGSLATRLT